MKIIIDAIVGEKKRNDFMHACDVFESFKHLGEYMCLKATASEGFVPSEFIEKVKKQFESGDVNVIFISIKSIDGTLNKDYPPYIKPGVSSISNGHQFGLFDNMLKSLGYTVETDQSRKVLSAKL